MKVISDIALQPIKWRVRSTHTVTNTQFEYDDDEDEKNVTTGRKFINC